MSEKLTAALYKLDLLVSKQDRGVSRYENSTQTHTHTHTRTDVACGDGEDKDGHEDIATHHNLNVTNHHGVLIGASCTNLADMITRSFI
jgi:hypothetical protein